MKSTIFTIKCSLLFAIIFGVVSLIFYFGDWNRFFAVTFMGVFIGVIAAPEIKPKIFTYAWLLQSSAGIAFGLCLGFAFNWSLESILASAVISGLIGWLSPFWVKYVPIP